MKSAGDIFVEQNNIPVLWAVREGLEDDRMQRIIWTFEKAPRRHRFGLPRPQMLRCMAEIVVLRHVQAMPEAILVLIPIVHCQGMPAVLFSEFIDDVLDHYLYPFILPSAFSILVSPLQTIS